MKRLNLEYFKIKRLYNLRSSKKSALNSKKEAKKIAFTDNDIISILNTISPEKSLLRKTKNPKHLFLTLNPDLPFGPDPELVTIELFGTPGEFEEAKKLTVNSFNIERFEIQRNRYHPKLPRDFIEITLLEFYSLFKVAREGRLEKLITISFFLDSKINYAFLTPSPCTIKDLLKKLTTNPWRLESAGKTPQTDNDASGGSFTMYHPLTGEIISQEEKLERDTMVLVGNRMTLKPKGGFLFPFPYFNRRIVLEERKTQVADKAPPVRKSFNTCINCLSCVEYCPVQIHPSYIYHHIKRDNIEEAEKLNIELCILCGRCSFVCPAGLPLHKELEKTLSALKEQAE